MAAYRAVDSGRVEIRRVHRQPHDRHVRVGSANAVDEVGDVLHGDHSRVVEPGEDGHNIGDEAGRICLDPPASWARVQLLRPAGAPGDVINEFMLAEGESFWSVDASQFDGWFSTSTPPASSPTSLSRPTSATSMKRAAPQCDRRPEPPADPTAQPYRPGFEGGAEPDRQPVQHWGRPSPWSTPSRRRPPCSASS